MMYTLVTTSLYQGHVSYCTGTYVIMCMYIDIFMTLIFFCLIEHWLSMLWYLMPDWIRFSNCWQFTLEQGRPWVKLMEMCFFISWTSYIFPHILYEILHISILITRIQQNMSIVFNFYSISLKFLIVWNSKF